ncbi:unnamed protein product [Pocillopora meandrina]|uniref:Uncharacterized protein n=1 Tax=Pocillopora meandrina TaxID=46732 RepID=A0AAU9VV35_9CNID|nr:unnamed protein product [Pocillopora meandrina]
MPYVVKYKAVFILDNSVKTGSYDMSYALTLVIEVNGNLLQVTVMKGTRTKTVYDSSLGGYHTG